jgi:hypothetical protein
MDKSFNCQVCGRSWDHQSTQCDSGRYFDYAGAHQDCAAIHNYYIVFTCVNFRRRYSTEDRCAESLSDISYFHTVNSPCFQGSFTYSRIVVKGKVSQAYTDRVWT